MSVRWDCKPGDLDPEFAADVTTLLGDSPYSWCVFFGKRSCETQKTLYLKHLAGGPLAAPPGESAHEYGLAVDVCELVNGTQSWDTSRPAFPWLWEAIRVAPRLHSGHDFPPVAPADDDHIQSTRWQAVKAQLKASGKWGNPDCAQEAA